MKTTKMASHLRMPGAGSGASLCLVLACAAALAVSACDTVRDTVRTHVADTSKPQLTPGCDSEQFVELMASFDEDMKNSDPFDPETAEKNRQRLRDLLSKAGCTQRDLDAVFDVRDFSRCEDGDGALAFLLGQAYSSGRLLTPDPDRAFKYTRTAAECGVVFGQRSLSMMYREGFGTPQDDVRSLAWCLLHNAAEMHRVHDDEGKRFSWRMDCDKIRDRMTRSQHREARKLRDELYGSYRSTSPDGL